MTSARRRPRLTSHAPLTDAVWAPRCWIRGRLFNRMLFLLRVFFLLLLLLFFLPFSFYLPKSLFICFSLVYRLLSLPLSCLAVSLFSCTITFLIVPMLSLLFTATSSATLILPLDRDRLS